MILKMITIQLVWLLLAASFTGVGAAVRRSLRLSSPSSLGSSFWTGWGVTIGALQVAHLFFACRSATLLLTIAAAGVAGLVWCREPVAAEVLSAWRRRPALCVALAALAVWASNHALGPLLTVDAGLYHLSAIRWAAEYPLVPGLGNLHGRLAFNSAYFLYLGWLDTVQVVALRAFQVGPWLLLLVAVAQLSFAIPPIRSHEPTPRRRALFAAVLLLPLFDSALLLHISSTSPDPVILILGIMIAWELQAVLFPDRGQEADARVETSSRNEDFARAGARGRFFQIALLAAAGITIKLSFAAFGGMALLIAAARVWRDAEKAAARRVLIPGLLAAVLLLVPWGIRGALLSGYPLYPSTLVSVDTSWRVPRERADAEMRWIQSWARWPGRSPEQVLGRSDWLRPWLGRLTRNADAVALFVLPALLLATGLVAMLLTRPSPRGRTWLLMAPSAVGAGFWFVTAPDPRFLGATLWCAAAVAIAELHSGYRGAGLVATAARWGAMGVAAAIALATIAFGLQLGAQTHGIVIQPGPHGGAYPLPNPTRRLFVTDRGLTLYVPAKGSQCWDTRLPCTPYPPRDLGLRTPDDLSSGFELQP